MNEAEIVQWMGRWLKAQEYDVDEDLGSRKITDVIVSSVDVVKMALDLEQAVDPSEEKVDVEELAPKFASLTFHELAVEIVKLVRSRGGG